MADHITTIEACRQRLDHPDPTLAAAALSAVAAHGDGDRADLATRVHAFLAEHPLPQGAKHVAQHLERLDINVALRARESDRLTAAMLTG